MGALWGAACHVTTFVKLRFQFLSKSPRILMFASTLGVKITSLNDDLEIGCQNRTVVVLFVNVCWRRSRCCRSWFGYAVKYAAEFSEIAFFCCLENSTELHGQLHSKVYQIPPTSTQMKLLVTQKVVKAPWGLQYVEVQADLQWFKLDWERVHD